MFFFYGLEMLSFVITNIEEDVLANSLFLRILEIAFARVEMKIFCSFHPLCINICIINFYLLYLPCLIKDLCNYYYMRSTR